MQGIDAHRIGEHVRFLANDLLEGRGTGHARRRYRGELHRRAIRVVRPETRRRQRQLFAESRFRGREDLAGHYRVLAAGAWRRDRT